MRIKKRFCLLCNKEIIPLHIEHHDKPESSMWKGGVVDKIAAGYGSDLDGRMYIIAICDNCIKDNPDKIKYIGNYM